MDFNEVMEKIRLSVEKDIGSDPYDKDIAAALGLKPEQYSNMKKHNRVPYKNIIDYCGKKRINLNWVLLNQLPESLEETTDEIYRIKILRNVNGSAGGGAFNDEEIESDHICIDMQTARFLGIVGNKNIEAITVVGDSMEPTISENAIIVINRDITNVDAGGIFAVNTTGGLLIKRVSVNARGDIDLISDNGTYPMMTVHPNEATIVGKVICALEKI